jgi:hypothetical protein
MWFAYIGNFAQWHILKVAEVKEIIEQNKQKIKVAALEDFAVEVEKPEVEKTFQNAMGQDSLTRFDQPKKKNKPNKNRRPQGQGQAQGQNSNQKANPHDRKRTDEVNQKPNPNQNKPRSNGPKIRNEKKDPNK